MTHPTNEKRECCHYVIQQFILQIFRSKSKLKRKAFFADTVFFPPKWKIAFYISACVITIEYNYQWMILKWFFFGFFFAWFVAGQSGHTSRQFFPYVSSESDLQHYKTISFRHSHNHEHRASSSLSNVPSDFKSDRIKVCHKVHQIKVKVTIRKCMPVQLLLYGYNWQIFSAISG